jgi:hypothetical protein
VVWLVAIIPLTLLPPWCHYIRMGRYGSLLSHDDPQSYSAYTRAEMVRRKKKQEKCVHPDEKVVIICRACLAHLETKGYVARRRDVV